MYSDGTHELRSRSLINALCEFWAAGNLDHV
jgi:hypothetical protein